MSQTNPKTQAEHETAVVVLDRLFTGEQTAAGLGGQRVLEIQRHIADCDACRRRFDELAVGERVLLGRKDGQSGDFERGFRDASVVGAIDEMLAEEQSGQEGVEESGDGGAEVVPMPQRSGWQRLAMPLSAAAALMLVAAVGIWASGDLGPLPGDPGGEDQFQPRSVKQIDDSRAYEKPSIELFCAREVGGDVIFEGSSDAPFGLLSCPGQSRIKFGYRSADPQLRHAAFFGVDRAGEIYWYGPSPAQAESWEIQPQEKMTPVGDTIELEINHQPGRVRVYGLFTPRPMDFAEFEAMLMRSDKAALFRSADFRGTGFDGAWATETFEVVAEGEE